MKLNRRKARSPILFLSLLLLITTTERPQAHRNEPHALRQPQTRCPTGWETVEDIHFVVMLPRRVAARTSSLTNVPTGQNPRGVMYRVTADGITYTVRSLALADGSDREKMKSFRDVYRQSLGAANDDGGPRLLFRGREEHDGAPGEQYEVQSAGVRGMLHLYARDGRLFTLEAMPAPPTDVAQCFLSTLVFKGPQPPPPETSGTNTGGGRRPENDIGSTRRPPPPPEKFSCDCGDGVFVEAKEGDSYNHGLVVCPYPEMVYPNQDRRAGSEGDGVLLVKFPATGPPVVLQVLRSVTPTLDQSAIEALRKTKFCPRMVKGVPEEVSAEQSFSFRIVRETNAPRQPTRRRRRP